MGREGRDGHNEEKKESGRLGADMYKGDDSHIPIIRRTVSGLNGVHVPVRVHKQMNTAHVYV